MQDLVEPAPTASADTGETLAPADGTRWSAGPGPEGVGPRRWRRAVLPPAGFCHLHVHTHYSALDGACKVEDLVARAVELGMPALAITDHGVLSGIIQFYQQCRKAGIKPIIGLEAYVVEDRFRKEGQNEERWHLTLLARDDDGLPQPAQAGQPGLPRGLLLQAAHGLRSSREHARASSVCPAAPAAGSRERCRTGSSRRRTAEVERLIDIFGDGERLPGDPGDGHPRVWPR